MLAKLVCSSPGILFSVVNSLELVGSTSIGKLLASGCLILCLAVFILGESMDCFLLRDQWACLGAHKIGLFGPINLKPGNSLMDRQLMLHCKFGGI